ncbi:MAG TPA: hypothetical protein DHW82_03960 [Spirochaetia bacterium]|nr:MAG: hypothetical protein A2Y41_01690 [Spirochaetes bacterium GWB1_36_13]HCL56148.1 hypothetical protein [Spirochaetia bacterium]
MKKQLIFFLLFFHVHLFAKESEKLEYIIKKGDSLSLLCQKFNLSEKDLLQHNEQETLKRFWEGDSISIPLKNTKIVEYRIQKGDTLLDIIYRHKTSLEILYALNDEKKLERMWEGDTLILPCLKKTREERKKIIKKEVKKENDSSLQYTVQKGDTLFKISKKFNIPLNELKQLLKSDTLYAGTVLFLPQKKEEGFFLKKPLYASKIKLDFPIPAIHFQMFQDSSLLSPVDGTITGIREIRGYGKGIFIQQGDYTVIIASKGLEAVSIPILKKIKINDPLAQIKKDYFIHFFVIKSNEFLDPLVFIKK